MIRNCSTCERSESHRWCCVQKRLELAGNDLEGYFWNGMEETETRFFKELGVGVKFGADLLIDYQVHDCPRWVERSRED
ncbi:MAG: hypothetical protein GX295_01175 [Syntrophomonadaceae bacterium]|nr:hypothetical protein [Syntrophomonadaceae bacterium]